MDHLSNDIAHQPNQLEVGTRFVCLNDYEGFYNRGGVVVKNEDGDNVFQMDNPETLPFIDNEPDDGIYYYLKVKVIR